MAILNRWRVRPALVGAAAGGGASDANDTDAVAVPRAAVHALRREAVRHVAVFVQNRARFGTLVCHIPLVSSLRRHYPTARLTIVSPFPEASMLIGPGLADELRAWPPQWWLQARVAWALGADVMLTLRPASIFIDLLVGLSGAPARLGFATAIGRRLFSAAPPRDLGIYRPLNYLRLVETLGVEPALSAYLEAMAREAEPRLDPDVERYCFLPGGAAPFKRWGIDNFLALGARIRAERPAARFVVVLGPAEQALRAAIAASPIAAATDVLDTPTLGILAQAILASCVTVANDCGPSHVAQLLGRPYVGVFANQRGQAERIASQWFYPRPGADWITGPVGTEITAIPVDAVYEKVVAVGS